MKRKKEERKFILVVKAYKYCLMATDVLLRIKQPPIMFMTRKDVDEYENISKDQFLKIVSHFADLYLEALKQEHKVFEDLYDCYAELRLFFKKNEKVTRPFGNLLYAHNRIKELLENLKHFNQLYQDTVPVEQGKILRITKNAMVQIWENIELDEQQKKDQDKVEELDGVKGVRKFYYLNNLINTAKKEVDNIFPKLIS